jgi:hypothetical protein
MTEVANDIPIKVHVASIGTEASAAMPSVPSREVWTAHYETFQLTANDPVQCILPEDATRVVAYILALDVDIVIGTKNQAAASQNTVANVPYPIGTYVPKALTSPYPVQDCDAVYAGVTTSANSRVSVAAYYRS